MSTSVPPVRSVRHAAADGSFLLNVCGEYAMANTDVLADADDRRNGHAAKAAVPPRVPIDEWLNGLQPGGA
jgi:hypothetical protein